MPISADHICGYKTAGTLDVLRGGSRLKTFRIALAQTPAQHEKGLMDCMLMGEGTGLLFAFENVQQRYFWMKNTYIPLAIVYISEKLEILNIQKGEPQNAALLPSEGAAKFVLEINWSELGGIKKGDKISFRLQ